MEQLSHYQIIKKLGKGAFGETFLAEKNHKQVVIKQLKLNQVDHWKALERFEREAEVLKQLDHPGVPDYIDFIETEKSAGIVQKYIDGESLEAVIQKGKISQKLLESIIQQGLDILNYLQNFTSPIIHRDISPKNFLLDQNNKLYLIDFGGVQKSCAYNSDTVTCMGTFGYMAPEQIMGQATPQSDLFSFGMVLINLISGKRLEELPTDPKTGKLKISKIVKKQPKQFKKLIIEMIQPGISQRLQTPARGLEILREEEYQPLKNILITPLKDEIFNIYSLPKVNNISVGRYPLFLTPPLLLTLQQNKSYPLKSFATIFQWLFAYVAIFAAPLTTILIFTSTLPLEFNNIEIGLITLFPFFLYLFTTLTTGFTHAPDHLYHHHNINFTPDGYYYFPEINHGYEASDDTFYNMIHSYHNLKITRSNREILFTMKNEKIKYRDDPPYYTLTLSQFQNKTEAVECYEALKRQITGYKETEKVFK